MLPQARSGSRRLIYSLFISTNTCTSYGSITTQQSGVPSPLAARTPFPKPRLSRRSSSRFQTDVFAINAKGSLTVSWVMGGGAWLGPNSIGRESTFIPGAPIARCQHFGDVSPNQMDVFVVDKEGRLNVAWVVDDAWLGPSLSPMQILSYSSHTLQRDSNSASAIRLMSLP
jgi:hypothetical protein